MRNSATLALALSCIVSTPLAYAADSTAESLTRIEAETAVLKARARKMEVQAQIASKQAEIAKLTAPAVAGDPTVRSVEGMGSKLYATLQLENGTAMDVRAGDVLPNGMKVESIGPNEVIVRKPNKRRYRLATTPAPQPVPGTTALPPLPAPMAGSALPLPLGKGMSSR
ncbi:MAG TPA: type IV pilus biogenesis protein PilP [Albitalea sp.]|uniref:type IV pilus biogenesis protein PilP n=1 Tax=Piscinibacter sp. TaxID=1903157 RepID=UPI002ED4A689